MKNETISDWINLESPKSDFLVPCICDISSSFC